MAKYVLLSFDDDKDADEFVENLRQGFVNIVTEYWGTNVKALVRGVWRKPTKFCGCTGSMKNRGFTRGKKYGWWVCAKCGRPTIGWARGDHWFLALGKNLLPVSNGAPEYRGDGVFARHYRECPDCHTTLVTEVGHAQTTTWCPKCERDV